MIPVWILMLCGFALFVSGFAAGMLIIHRGRRRGIDELFTRSDRIYELIAGGGLFRLGIDEAAKRIAETGCELLDVERSGIWLYNDDYTILACSELFLRRGRVHERGERLDCSTFPVYVGSHREYHVVSAEDVFESPETRNIPAEYFRERGIGALLDTPLWIDGRVGGVLSFEHVGGRRRWTKDDERTAAILASVYSLCAETNRRRESDRALRESESKLHSIASNLYNGMIYQVRIHPDGKRHFTYASEGAEHIHGFSPAAVMKDPSLIYSQIHPEDRAFIASEEERTTRDLVPFDVETRLVMPSGEIRWSRIFSRPRREADGSIISDGLEIDITERKRAELELRQNEENSRITLNSIGDGVISADIGGRVIRMNPVAERLTGWTEAEASGRPFSEVFSIINASTRKPSGSPFERIMASGTVTGLEPQTLLVSRDGNEHLIADSGAPIRNERGEVSGVVLVFRDITYRSKLEAEAAQSELVFRTIFEMSPYSIVILKASDGTYLLANPSWERRVGYSLSEVRGKTDVELGIIRADERRRETTERLMRDGFVQDEVYPYMAKDGRSGYVMLAARLFDYNGEKCILAMTVDITEQRKLQEQLAQARKMDAIGQLAGGIAHDFNNMLGGIMGAAEMLGFQMKGTPKSEQYLSMIQMSARRAADLAGKLLSFARKKPVQPRPFDIHMAVTEACDILGRTVDRKVVIRTALEAHGATVMGDVSQVMNVFLNLGINAAHAMPDGGELVFRSRALLLDEAFCRMSPFGRTPGEYILIEVQDSGTGIEPENISRIFEPFFTTGEQEGTGLGLAAVYGTVRQHQGAITVYSEKGKGTVFHVYFPLSRGADVPEDRADESVRGTGTVLVVDDEEMIRVIASDILSFLGYTVLTAADGREGVELYREKRGEIDLVILDMVMPVMNGREALAAMREIDPSLKVLVASGFVREEDAEGLRQFGVDHIVRKPFQTAELSRLVHDAIRGGNG